MPELPAHAMVAGYRNHVSELHARSLSGRGCAVSRALVLVYLEESNGHWSEQWRGCTVLGRVDRHLTRADQWPDNAGLRYSLLRVHVDGEAKPRMVAIERVVCVAEPPTGARVAPRRHPVARRRST